MLSGFAFLLCINIEAVRQQMTAMIYRVGVSGFEFSGQCLRFLFLAAAPVILKQ